MEMKNVPEPVIAGSKEGQETLPRVGDAWNSGGENQLDEVEVVKTSWAPVFLQPLLVNRNA